MKKQTKDEKVFVRMPQALRDQIAREARVRGEAESVIVREALREYFDRASAAELNERHHPALARK